MLEFICGLVFGTGLTVGFGFYAVKLMNARMEETVNFSKTRIEDYKEAFSKGYETVNHFTPFVEQKAAGVFEGDDQTLYQMEKGSIFDEEEEIEYEERID